jgi:glycosyltransferase involved in cell wall biosynthesis
MASKINIDDWRAGNTPIISIFDNLVFADKSTYDRLMKSKLDGKPMWRHATDEEIYQYVVSRYTLPWDRIKVMMHKNNTSQTGYGKLGKLLDQAMSSEDVQKVTVQDNSQIVFICNSVWSLGANNLLHNIKSNIEKTGSKQKIVCFTMWETDKWHPYHLEALEPADLVIVPCEWNKKTLEKCGFKKPIVVCPLPLDTFVDYHERPERSKFTFLTYNGGDTRKGFPLYLEAFRDEFKNEDDVEYIVKTSFEGVFAKNIKEFKANNNISNVKYITQQYNNDQMQELLNNADCFVFPSSGEGWGYTPLEAVVSGLPVILPKKHAFVDHWNSAYIEVEASKTKAEFQTMEETYIEDDIGKWYQVDKKDLQKKMREVYEAWRAGDKTPWQNATKESAKIKKLYSISETSKRLGNILTNQFLEPKK